MSNLKLQIDAFKELNSVYKDKTPYISTVQASIKPLVAFGRLQGSKESLLIKGRLITAGSYKDKRVTGQVIMRSDILKKTLHQWAGLPIYTSHKVLRSILTGDQDSVRDIVGKITNVSWNEKDQGIEFVAEIVDEDIASKMVASLIQFISADFFSDIKTDFNENKKLENYYTGVEPMASSLVYDPRDKLAKFEPIST